MSSSLQEVSQSFTEWTARWTVTWQESSDKIREQMGFGVAPFHISILGGKKTQKVSCSPKVFWLIAKLTLCSVLQKSTCIASFLISYFLKYLISGKTSEYELLVKENSGEERAQHNWSRDPALGFSGKTRQILNCFYFFSIFSNIVFQFHLLCNYW